jgi:hypothetical protein
MERSRIAAADCTLAEGAACDDNILRDATTPSYHPLRCAAQGYP